MQEGKKIAKIAEIESKTYREWTRVGEDQLAEVQAKSKLIEQR